MTTDRQLRAFARSVWERSPEDIADWQAVARAALDHPRAVTVTVGDGRDLTQADFDRLVQLVADANAAADLKDEQLQRIETTLDLALIQVENENEAAINNQTGVQP